MNAQKPRITIAMNLSGPALPIDPLLPDLVATLKAGGQAVLQAPPGAGKTTRVPLALMGHAPGRIVMLEPRRLAARAAAERLAETLGQKPGADVGYRMRGESVPGALIEVVTEGILTRMIQSDPELAGVGAVIFDEFHERSLNGDLGLALMIEARAALRPDLWLVVMSATLDAAPVAALMGAPVLTAEGRAFPVETRWLDRPASGRLAQDTADLVRKALAETEGGVLAFLPGERELRQCAAALGDLQRVALHLLYGAMPFRDQRAALSPGTQRKVVLATAIAETSLTIPDIRVVVDAGRARRARFDAASGMARLVTEPVSRAEAEQRRGRAGRVAPGICYRLWTRGAEGALPAHPPAEIETGDLAGLALELAQWGAQTLPFVTPPPAPALSEARALLRDLDALDGAGRITDHGRKLAALPLHPRLGHMLLRAGAGAAPLAALLGERDPLIGAPADLTLRLSALRDPGGFRREHPYELRRDTLERIRTEALRLARLAPPPTDLTPAQAAALAYPDRIGIRRKGDAPRFLLSGGKGAVFDAADPLGAARLVVVTDLDGDPREARVRQAIALTESDLRALHGVRIGWVDSCTWSSRERRVLARRQERLGALVLADRPWPDAPPEALGAAALEGLREIGLGACLSPGARRFLARVRLIPDQMPDLSDAGILCLPHLAAALAHCRSAEDLRALDLTDTLRAALTWEQFQLLDRLAPAQFETPLGRKVVIDYSAGQPEIAVRLQEMFGVTLHPVVGQDRIPLKITLLSPAQRPVQVTTDLPGFWATSYADVRKDMRGQYPRHPWPEDPTQADPTLRAKPRGT
jgi:ATP-dependent helicase HrpB